MWRRVLACFEFYHELDLTCPSHLLLQFQQYNLIRVPREARLVNFTHRHTYTQDPGIFCRTLIRECEQAYINKAIRLLRPSRGCSAT